MTNKPETGDLRGLVAAKLGIGERQLYNRAKELANRASLKIAEAIWVIAAQNQINLTKYLPPEAVERVRVLLPQIPAPPRAAPAKPRKHTPPPAPSKPREFVVAKEFRGQDPILSAQVLEEARQMAVVYPLLYVLENSMREFIRRLIDARRGIEWWTSVAPTSVRTKILGRMTEEQKNAWHQRRGNHPVDYLDLNELASVVRNNLEIFVPDFLPNLPWFEQFVNELYQSRCVLCHMNPLLNDNLQDVKLKLKKWQRLVNEKKAALP